MPDRRSLRTPKDPRGAPRRHPPPRPPRCPHPDPSLLAAAESRGLGPQLNDYVTAQIARRSPPTSPGAVRTATTFQDPELHPDVRWQFIRIVRDSDPKRLFPLLKNMPGFAASSALQEAWGRATLTNNQYPLWELALERGFPGALEFGIRSLYKTGTSDKIDLYSPVAPLIVATAYKRALDSFFPWIEKYAVTFEFEPESGTYQPRELP